MALGKSFTVRLVIITRRKKKQGMKLRSSEKPRGGSVAGIKLG